MRAPPAFVDADLLLTLPLFQARVSRRVAVTRNYGRRNNPVKRILFVLIRAWYHKLPQVAIRTLGAYFNSPRLLRNESPF